MERGGFITKVFLIFSCSILLLTHLYSASGTQSQAAILAGRWKIEFTLGLEHHSIQFDVQASGEATFLVLDQRSNLAAPATPTQARWSLKGQSPAIYYFVITGDVEFPKSNGGFERGRLEFNASADLDLPVTSLNGWGGFHPPRDPNDIRGGEDPGFWFTATRVDAPVVKVLSPSSGQKLRRGRDLIIEWEAKSVLPLVSQVAELSADGGESFIVIAPSLGGDIRSFTWNVPVSFLKTKRALIKIVATDTNGASGEGLSAGDLRIK